MDKSTLRLNAYTDTASANTYRTTFTTKHGRKLYLSLKISNENCTIIECFYSDRNQNRTGKERYRSKPLMLRTFEFSLNQLLNVIETELDKKFYNIEFFSGRYR